MSDHWLLYPVTGVSVNDPDKPFRWVWAPSGSKACGVSRHVFWVEVTDKCLEKNSVTLLLVVDGGPGRAGWVRKGGREPHHGHEWERSQESWGDRVKKHGRTLGENLRSSPLIMQSLVTGDCSKDAGYLGTCHSWAAQTFRKLFFYVALTCFRLAFFIDCLCAIF